MEDMKSKKFWQHIGVATVGMLLFAMGINLFIVPAGTITPFKFVFPSLK